MLYLTTRQKPRRSGGGTRLALAAFLALLVVAPAGADICKYLDAEGTIHYSNMPPEKAWKRVSCSESDTGPQKKSGPESSSSNTVRSSASPTNFPRVDATTQRGRDDVRRKVLQDELKVEEKLLDDSRNAYTAGAKPLADEKNTDEKYRDRVAKLRAVIQTHQKNVDALRKEIGALK